MKYTGKIPLKLVYVSSTDKYLSPNVHLGHYNTFVTNFDSYQEQTAKNWARANPIIVEMDNKPLTDVELVGTSGRGENRKIFRVLIHKKYVVDLTEESLLDACRTKEGVSNGNIQTPMIWAIVNGKLKLIPVNGAMYKDIVQFMETSKIKPIKIKDLKKGYIYEDKYGTQEIYLGKVGTQMFSAPTNHFDHCYISTEKAVKYIKEVGPAPTPYETILNSVKRYYSSVTHAYYQQVTVLLNSIT